MKNQELKVKVIVPAIKYCEPFKKAVVNKYKTGILNKDQIKLKYGIGGNSMILDWCRKYGKLHHPLIATGRIGRPMKDPQKQRIKDLEK